jgi:hypothetical protein
MHHARSTHLARTVAAVATSKTHDHRRDSRTRPGCLGAACAVGSLSSPCRPSLPLPVSAFPCPAFPAAEAGEPLLVLGVGSAYGTFALVGTFVQYSSQKTRHLPRKQREIGAPLFSLHVREEITQFRVGGHKGKGEFQFLERDFDLWRRSSIPGDESRSLRGGTSSARRTSIVSPGGFRGSESGIITCGASPDITCGYISLGHQDTRRRYHCLCSARKAITNSGGFIKTSLFASSHDEVRQHSFETPEESLYPTPRLPSLENKPKNPKTPPPPRIKRATTW